MRDLKIMIQVSYETNRLTDRNKFMVNKGERGWRKDKLGALH